MWAMYKDPNKEIPKTEGRDQEDKRQFWLKVKAVVRASGCITSVSFHLGLTVRFNEGMKEWQWGGFVDVHRGSHAQAEVHRISHESPLFEKLGHGWKGSYFNLSRGGK